MDQMVSKVVDTLTARGFGMSGEGAMATPPPYTADGPGSGWVVILRK